MIYYRGRYKADDSTAIMAYTDDGEPYSDCTVCLIDYGMIPPDENHVFVPTYKMFGFEKVFIDALVDKIVSKVPIGYGEGLLVKLKDNWKELTVPFDAM